MHPETCACRFPPVILYDVWVWLKQKVTTFSQDKTLNSQDKGLFSRDENFKWRDKCLLSEDKTRLPHKAWQKCKCLKNCQLALIHTTFTTRVKWKLLDDWTH